MARKGNNIYKRKDGRYEGRYIKGRGEDGMIRYGYVYGRHYEEVLEKVMELKEELGDPNKKYLIIGDGSFTNWADYWCDELKRSGIKESTYALYTTHLRTHIKPFFSKLPLRKVAEEAVTEFLTELTRKRLAESTRQSIFRLLKAILREAMEKGAVPVFHLPELKRKGRKQKTRFLTREEQERLERTAEADRRFEVLLGLYTGMRIGEISALRWKDLDLGQSVIHVRHTISRISSPDAAGKKKTRLICTSPKTEDSIREIPIPRFLSEILMKLKETKQSNEQEYVFGKGGHPSEPRVLQNHIKQLANEADIAGLHFHTLRHTFATRCLEHGFDIEVLKELMGHSSAVITLNVYGHCTREQKKVEMNKFEKVA